MKWTNLFFGLQTIAASVLGIWLLLRWNKLLLFVRKESLRKHLKIVLITCSFYAAYQPANYGWYTTDPGVGIGILIGAYAYMSALALITTTVYTLALRSPIYRTWTQQRQIVATFALIAATPVLAELILAPLVGFRGIDLIWNISFTLWGACFAATIFLFFENYTSRQLLKLQQQELELSRLDALHTQARLDALQAKVSPHFLYNTLNAMAGLALEDGAKTSQMAVALSTLFRYNLNQEQQVLATVQEEIEMVAAYLGIEQIRFEEKLRFELNIAPKAKQCYLPRFTLQTLVENCIKHAGSGDSGVLHIKVLIRETEGGLLLEVADNGKPFPAGLHPGFGLQSLHDKLQLSFPGRHTVEISNEPKKISMTLHYE
ncbi:MAG TPA: histidine kinase [Chitinophagaceae bacterium]|nr:histidine kinase [Chitinophagaceae bacterium]